MAEFDEDDFLLDDVEADLPGDDELLDADFQDNNPLNNDENSSDTQPTSTSLPTPQPSNRLKPEENDDAEFETNLQLKQKKQNELDAETQIEAILIAYMQQMQQLYLEQQQLNQNQSSSYSKFEKFSAAMTAVSSVVFDSKDLSNNGLRPELSNSLVTNAVNDFNSKNTNDDQLNPLFGNNNSQQNSNPTASNAPNDLNKGIAGIDKTLTSKNNQDDSSGFAHASQLLDAAETGTDDFSKTLDDLFSDLDMSKGMSSTPTLTPGGS